SATAQTPPRAEFEPLKQDVVWRRLETVPRRMSQRASTLESLFQVAGCAQVTRQPIKHSKDTNVLCTLPADAAQTADTIVVGGHFDFVDRGIGAVDDWSGVALLPSLFEALKARPRRHTFVFAGFASEERGLLGSQQYVKDLSVDERGHVRAM